LRSEGVGAEEHETEVVSPEEEIKLWETSVLSAGTPKGLLNAVFFYNGKNFLLRGGAEHRSLKFSQLTRSFNTDGLYISRTLRTAPRTGVGGSIN